MVQLARVQASQPEPMNENERINLLDESDITGASPLILSVRNNFTKIALFLIDKVNDINAVDSVQGML